MHEGLNYITMRDGVTLAATVRYPSAGVVLNSESVPHSFGVLGLQRGRSH